jgi:drug/metabolite transporter (DMT)-like permease
LPLLIGGVMALAFSPIFVRWSEVGPVATAVNRMALPLPVFWIAWGLQRAHMPRPSWRDLWLLALGGAFFAGDLIVWHWSVRLTSVANATLLANLSPLFVIAAAWLMFRERVGRTFLMGVAVALIGVALLMSRSLSLSAATLLGDGLGLATAGFYAGYLLTVARVRQRVSAVATMAVGGTAAALILLPIALVWEGQVWPDTGRGWAVALGLAVVTQIIGQMLITTALAHVPTGLGALMLLLQPALAAVLAWLLFGESLSALQAGGGVAILLGLELARRGAKAQRD